MPTKAAARNSIPSMKRSMARRMGSFRQRVVPFELRDQISVDGVGVEAGGLHLRGPFRLQRFGGLAPEVGLLRRDLVNLMAGHRFQFGVAGVFEVSPGRGDFFGPFGGAVGIDDGS